MRPLRWDAFGEALRSVGRARGAAFLDEATPWVQSRPGGHRQARVRVRVGQGGFRQRLLATQGPVCAFTGPGPAAALEAAHLYSYAAVGQHHDDGGLLLRRDVHRLFDQGDIAVDPRTQLSGLRAPARPAARDEAGPRTSGLDREALEPAPAHWALTRR